MRLVSALSVGVLLALACGPAAAQYGGGGGGYGGSGYSPPSPPTPSPPSPYRSPSYQPPHQPVSPYGGPQRNSPYGGQHTSNYGGQAEAPYVPATEYQTVYEEYLYCENCNKKVPTSSKAGQRCPHCGVYWTHDDKGNEAPGGTGGGFAGIIGLVVAVVLIGVRLLVRMMRS